MTLKRLEDLLSAPGRGPLRGPVAVILAEDDVEVESTVAHHLHLGFRTVFLLCAAGVDVPATCTADPRVEPAAFDIFTRGAREAAVNAVIEAAPGQWIFYCFNAEYLLFPFCESRTVGEMLAFHAEERRDAMLTYVVDLYAGDLGKYPDAVSLDEAYLDRSGYYALGRQRPDGTFHERQLDFFGGLRWRFEEHVPPERRRIDRISLFRARPGLKLGADHRLNDEEFNTYACPWHHNLTAAVCSFRTAKALKRNPGSTFEITTFRWHNSATFEWHSAQLLDLGLMEPGQWF